LIVAAFKNVTTIDRSRNLLRPTAIAVMKFVVGCAVASFGYNVADAASPVNPSDGTWRSEPAMHYARAAHAVCRPGNVG
jgi:hypothetical protein